MTKNDIVTLRIDGYASGGDGVAHYDGRAVFVRRAIMGELIRARILKVTKAAVFAKIEGLIEPSPERQTPECAHFGKCGGCSLMHMSYREELRYKHLRVSDAFCRIGGAKIELPDVVPSPEILRYRNKAIFEVGFEHETPITGFYRERSHDIIAVSDCLIQTEIANRAAAAVRSWMKDSNVEAGLVRYVFCRTAKNGTAQIVIVSSRKGLPEPLRLIDTLRENVPEISGILQCVNSSDGNVVLNGSMHVLFGDEFLCDKLCGNEFRLSPQSFYQVNHAQAEALYACAVDFAGLTGAETALELYSGAGTITLALAGAAKRIYGVEVIPEAVQNAGKNAARNGISNVEFILGDAGAAALELNRSGIRPDVVVVDPPRKGLSAEVISATAKMSPKRIVYVSCDPATLARDIKLLAAEGFAVSKAKTFDMFPRCAHVETVVLLTRAE